MVKSGGFGDVAGENSQIAQRGKAGSANRICAGPTKHNRKDKREEDNALIIEAECHSVTPGHSKNSITNMNYNTHFSPMST